MPDVGVLLSLRVLFGGYWSVSSLHVPLLGRQ